VDSFEHMQFLRVHNRSEMKANVAKPDTKPTAISILANVTEMVLQFRGEKPTIASIA
jgi:hypothetical protein